MNKPKVEPLYAYCILDKTKKRKKIEFIKLYPDKPKPYKDEEVIKVIIQQV